MSEQPEQSEQPRKYYLTDEQARVVDTLGEYERAYIARSVRGGGYMVLNGDPQPERIRDNTLVALVRKGYLQEFGKGRYKLI